MGDGGLDVCRALTAALDAGIAALAAPLAGERFAVVAVGGYGRGEQCLHSDIDVMLLHGGRLPEKAIQSVMYPLWDTRIKVGHAVRGVKDALRAAREHVQTLTALLDARAVAGDGALVAELWTELGALLRRGALNPVPELATAEHNRREREPFQLLAADLKEGRGGLRALQSLHWRRRIAVLAGTPAATAPAEEQEARAVLLATRNALHAAAGRPHERYDADLRPATAAWLDMSIDKAGQRLYRAQRAIDALAALCWAETPAGRPADRPARLPFLRRSSSTAAPATATEPDRVDPYAAPLSLALRTTTRGRAPGVFTPEEQAAIRQASAPLWDNTDRQALLGLLRAGMRGWEAFAELERLGWLARALPEWTHTVAAPQHAPFHLHPLDVHLWRTVIEMLAITRPDSDEPWCQQVAQDLGNLDDVLLTALLHDIGKGHDGDHSIQGAIAVSMLCRRTRFGPALTGTVAGVVRHHLLLPAVATRRDIDDPRVITHVADQAGDLRSLRILFLLAVADSRASGPAVWTPWKASLVRALFARASGELMRRQSAEAHSPLEEQQEAALIAAAAGQFEPAAIHEHLSAMPPSYLTSFDASDLLRHVEAMTPPPEPGEVLVGVRDGDHSSNAIVVTADRPGLISLISGVFALHNVSVLDGRFFTRADGTVLDAFHVEDALGGDIDAQRWEKVRAGLARALAGDLPLEDLLQEKARAYHRDRPPPPPARVEVDTGASDSFTVVEVHCADRVGVLHDIARALFEQGLDIRLAKIDTQGHEVVDTFYVRDLDGEPVRDPDRHDAIRAAVTERLAAGAVRA